jgi:hypothetical protein
MPGLAKNANNNWPLVDKSGRQIFVSFGHEIAAGGKFLALFLAVYGLFLSDVGQKLTNHPYTDQRLSYFLFLYT